MRTLIIGDVHGNLEALKRLLERVNVDSSWRLIQVGDLANMAPKGVTYRGQIRQDEATLRFALDNDFEVLVGNHEVYYTHNLECGKWAGMASSPADLETDTMTYIRTLINRGEYKAATHAHGWLITHAGIHPNYIPEGMDAEALSEYLNDALIECAVNHSDMLFPAIGSVGLWSGGRQSQGGIFWLRPQEWKNKHRSDIPQIVGHTPDDRHPRFVDVRNTWYIDDGVCAGIKWTDDEKGWEVA